MEISAQGRLQVDSHAKKTSAELALWNDQRCSLVISPCSYFCLREYIQYQVRTFLQVDWLLALATEFPDSFDCVLLNIYV